MKPQAFAVGIIGLAVVLVLLSNVALAQDITPAVEAPAGATVVEAFSKQHAMCEGLTEWTVEATPDDWIYIGA